MALYLYRVTENDSDGDPLDFGILRATSEKEATRVVGEHLVKILGEETKPMEFKLYEVADSPFVGVLSSRAATLHSHPNKKRKGKS